MKKIIDKGDWGHSQYEVYLDIDGSFEELRPYATGAFAVCFDENEKLVLANNEPLGGKIEINETVEQALQREALEEGGVELFSWKYYGNYKIVQKENATKEFKSKYPKEGYLIFFLSKGKRIMKPYGNDVKSFQVLDKSIILNSKNITHKLLIEGVKLYPYYLN